MRMLAQWSSSWTNMESTTSSRWTPVYRWNIQLQRRSLSKWTIIFSTCAEHKITEMLSTYLEIWSLFLVVIFGHVNLAYVKWIANQKHTICVYIIYYIIFFWPCMSGGYCITSEGFLLKATSKHNHHVHCNYLNSAEEHLCANIQMLE